MDIRVRKVSHRTKTPDAGYVRIGPISAIPDLLRKYSRETPEQILAEVGIDLKLFEDPENSISFVKIGQLFTLCAKYTGLPHFGLLVGQHAGPNVLGRLSEFGIHSPNVGSALNNMIQHLCIHDRGSIPTLATDNGTAIFGYAIYLPMPEGASQVIMTAMAINYNIMRSLCGDTWSPTQVLFTHSQPEDIQPYSSHFNSKLIFDAEINALVFPDHWLQKSIPGADAEQYRELVKEMTTIKSKVDVDLLEQIRSILPPMLVSGKCSETELAKVLSMHPRTLNRRLKENGVTFRLMVAETRYEISKQLLIGSKTSILGISTILGYADASTFTRAFERWSGESPKAWRVRNKT